MELSLQLEMMLGDIVLIGKVDAKKDVFNLLILSIASLIGQQ
jgi:hypothetical protein